MIELIFVFYLYRKLAVLAERKDRSPWLPLILPVLWFGMEILFGFLAFLFQTGHPVYGELHAYFFALLGGLLGAGIAFALVLFLPRNTRPLCCPECGWEFTEHGPLGLECETCGAWLRVHRRKVTRI